MDYFKKLEYIRLYNKTESILNRCSESIIHENKDGKVYVSGKAYQVGGWLGFVKHSGDLNDETTGENINKILILVRGKLAQENMLDEFREGGLYTKFLIGEIHADFLDLDDEEDIATSSRQSINENDERYIALKDFVQEELKNMGQERARYKTENAVKDAAEILPPVKEWIESYKGDNRKKARELIGKINQTSLNPEQKKDHFKHGIIAFERMNLKGSLDALVRVNADNIGEVIRLFSDYDDIEDAMYYEITHGRLTVIDKLQENIDNDAKEKVLQEYLFNHLWLLDPSWDRATEVPEMEKGITLKLNGMKEGETDEIKRGRIDIQYRKTSGKHLIIELKRTSVHPRHTEIIDQLDKYGTALENELKTRSIPISYEKIVIVGGKLQGWNIPNKEEKDRNTLKAENIRLLTYQELIHNAQLMYKEYLDKKAGKSKIFKILNRISES